MPKGTPNFEDLATDVIDVLVANGWKHSGVSRAGFWTVTQLAKGRQAVEVFTPAGQAQARVWLSPAKGGQAAIKSALKPLEAAGIDPAERRQKGVRLVRGVRRSRAKPNPVHGARRNPGPTLKSAARKTPPALRNAPSYSFGLSNPPLLPLTSTRRKWSGAEARRALRKWAASPSGRINIKKYARGFMAVDGDPNNLGSYKLPYAVPVKTSAGRVRLKAVPRAIEAIAAVLDGGRGGVELPPSQRRRARMFVARYYKKMGKVPPWRR